jgi:hypothetical protein
VALVDIDVVAVPDAAWGRAIERMGREFAARRVQEACRRIAARVVPELRDLVRRGLERSPEHAAVLGGELRRELGIADPGPALAAIADAAAASVRATTLDAAGDLLGGVEVGVFAADFADVLSAPGAAYESLNRFGRRTPVPWLRWMLFEGDAIIVQGYRVLAGDYDGSRTGPIMAGRPGGTAAWRVPAEFAGTPRSNWITRVAEDVAPEVLALLEREAARV